MTTVLDDINDAVKDYPTNYLTIEIIDVNWPGVAINDGEEVEFRFQVTNRGPLTMTDLSFKVEGRNGTEIKVSGAAAQWEDWHETRPGWFPDLNAHAGTTPVTWTGDPFLFRATNAFTTPRELVRVSVAGWQTTWDHMLTNHTEADPDLRGSYSSAVAVQ
ncbi:hypothetical protein HP550_06585 [Cellulomonas humilata]|uniref:Uncharacterized protein n=1 Tax=Cellulomonas humilata TaxID=144055 RepID=A0A7Y6DX29_9CELL|nr:hypothetical protein [Cellulomonas humilata]NUU16915.1 hypothetical protein [Cellulomonas humilata]